MTIIRPQSIIIKPIITEKTLASQEVSGKYHFWVGIKSNKDQIAAAFTQIFGITPLSVNTIILKGKLKTDWRKRMPIQKSNRKKAVISVPKDTKIDLLTLKK